MIEVNRARVLWETQPGRLLEERVADGSVFSWRGGPVALCTYEFWQDVLKRMAEGLWLWKMEVIEETYRPGLGRCFLVWRGDEVEV